LKILSNTTRYPNPTLMASVWTPPFYMKDPLLNRLIRSNEPLYYHYLKTVTALIQQKYGLAVERISPVNEPENIFAQWDHCNMNPAQLCRMVTQFNDPLISLCPENSYYWTTQLYLSYTNLIYWCIKSCKTIATHSYRLNIDSGSENFGLASYDLFPYPDIYSNPIWMTEVSSTYNNAQDHQMDDGLDLATSIVNFLGTTCVERYYYWIAYTNGPSGESLIWGNASSLTFPKKYFIFKHFTSASYMASQLGPVKITSCTNHMASCIRFDSSTVIFLNKGNYLVQLEETTDCSCGLCCTTEAEDMSCGFNTAQLPPRSVCTCTGGCSSVVGV